MGHPVLENRTPFSAEALFLADEDGRSLLVTLIKATYHCSNGLFISDVQVPYNAAGQRHPGTEDSSFKYESETAFVKLATDVVLVGHAYASQQGADFVDVGFKVGPVQKIVRVFGDRYWVKTGGSIIATKAKPFERMPLTYERAFGGWDKSNKDKSYWRCDARNPVGVGFGDPLRYVEEGKVPLPNIEDPNQLIRRYGDTPPPAGLGFVSPEWEPRAKYAGTYDAAWDKDRKPFLPKDFDRRFFNAASPGLITSGYLRGDEDVVVVNAAPITPLRFKLPGIQPLASRIALRNGKVLMLSMHLDTVIVNTDEMLVFVLWRSHVPVAGGPYDVVAIEVASELDLTKSAVA